MYASILVQKNFDKTYLLKVLPWVIGADRYSSNVKWPKLFSNFPEQWSMVACVSSKIERFPRTFHYPTTPQSLKIQLHSIKYITT